MHSLVQSHKGGADSQRTSIKNKRKEKLPLMASHRGCCNGVWDFESNDFVIKKKDRLAEIRTIFLPGPFEYLVCFFSSFL